MTVLQSVAPIALLLAVGVAGVGILRASGAMRALYTSPVVTDVEEEPTSRRDLGRLVAAVLLDHGGTEVSDFLLPYALLSASRAFDVYAVAPEHRPAVLTGGLDVMPQATHAGLDALEAGHVDLVVVPHMPDPDRRTIGWIRRQAEAGAAVLSICTGAGVVAAAGLLGGRRATAHWGDLARFERRYPEVRWERGVRFVDDGEVVASAGITSGIDATLHVIRRMTDDRVMRRAAAAVGYDDLTYLEDPAVEQHRIELADLVVAFAAAFARRPTLGVLLRDGVDETALAAVMDTYGANLVGRMLTVTSDGSPVRSRHGLTLLSRAELGSARPARLFAPTASADAGSVPAGAVAMPFAGSPYLAYRDAINDLGQTNGRQIARFAAKRLEHRRS